MTAHARTLDCSDHHQVWLRETGVALVGEAGIGDNASAELQVREMLPLVELMHLWLESAHPLPIELSPAA